MKITKYVHACLLVEVSDRVAIFDPGTMSRQALDVNGLTRLDDVFITHFHSDHFDLELVKKLIEKFPGLRITTTNQVGEELKKNNIKYQTDPPESVSFFSSPHESIKPLFPDEIEEIGIHYLGKFSDPGDSHSFSETKPILALPITAPWGSTIKALNIAINLKPKHVIPIHDWHWSEEARKQSYDRYAQVLQQYGITMHKPETGKPINIDI